MKIALISDLHCHPWQEFSTLQGKEKINDRLNDCLQVFEDVRLYCAEHAIGVIVIGGDLFHKRGVLYTQTYTEVVKKLARIKLDGFQVLCVDGNHDHANKAGTVTAVEGLWEAGLVEGINVGHGWENWHLEVGSESVVVTGFSYCDSRALFSKRLEEAGKEYNSLYPRTPRIGVFHHGFAGARVGTALEYVVKEDIQPSELKGHSFDYVFSGHYHQRQQIGSLYNAMYIGSPLEHTRGDGGQEKGFLVVDTAARAHEDYVTFVPLKRPRFVRVTQEMIDKVDPVKWGTTGNFVDVLYEEVPGGIEAFSDFLIKTTGARGVKPVLVRSKTVATVRLAVDPTLDTKTVLKRYLEYRKEDIDKAKLDPKALLALGLDIMNKATE